MGGLLERLAEIRELQGREAMPDPTVIHDDGTVFIPPGTFNPPTSTDDDFEERGGPSSDWVKSVSPLVAAAQPKPVIPMEDVRAKVVSTWNDGSAPAIPEPTLSVLDNVAMFQGHLVTLSEKEARAVTSVVLRALQRVVAGQLEELRKLAPRRRRGRVGAQASGPMPLHTNRAEENVSGQPKRRGRPKGSKNRAKA